MKSNETKKLKRYEVKISQPRSFSSSHFSCHGIMRSEQGMTLVITLVILVIITAMVTEFSYGVYTSTSSLYNWKDSQRLSYVARSGIALAAKTISGIQNIYSYTYPDRIDMPVINILEGFEGSIIVNVEDENSRFNLNSIVYENGTLNTEAYNSFKRLLKNLALKEDIADRITDWLDRDHQPRLQESEAGAKNAHMETGNELLSIKGIDYTVYEKLLPYVTVYGIDRKDAYLININTAPIPVIMSINDSITRELAERIVHYRDVEPFKRISDILKVAGFDGPVGQSLMSKIVVKASNFRIKATVEENKIKRIIESVVEIKGSSQGNIKYWAEI